MGPFKAVELKRMEACDTGPLINRVYCTKYPDFQLLPRQALAPKAANQDVEESEDESDDAEGEDARDESRNLQCTFVATGDNA